VHLYADLYACDIVLASPLGLRMLVGAEGDKKRDYDFLSSIEVAVFDQAEAYHMQNIDHLRTIASVMNKIPVTPRNADITRIRQWSLEGKGSYSRQTAIFSSVATPELRALFARGCNLVGRITFSKPSPGSVVRVVTQVRQVGQWSMYSNTLAPRVQGLPSHVFATAQPEPTLEPACFSSHASLFT